MPKFYLHQAGKIPTTVHPFVKQTTLPQDKHKPRLLPGKIIQDVQNIAMLICRRIFIAIAPLTVGIANRGRLRHRPFDSGQATSKPLDRHQL
jgi:hypothetical protein